MPHLLVSYTIFQLNPAPQRRGFSYLLTAVKNPFYLTLLNKINATRSFTISYKAPILPAYRTGRLLVKATLPGAGVLLNNLPNTFLTFYLFNLSPFFNYLCTLKNHNLYA
jgi:hypothetical protein